MARGSLAELPQSFNAISVERPIITDQRDIFSDSLGNQHAIERVGVWTGQQPGAQAMVRTYRENSYPVSGEIGNKILHQARSGGQPSKTNFGSNFPSRSRTDQ